MPFTKQYFVQTLIEISPVVLENKSKMWKVCWRTDDGQTGDQKISHTSAKTLNPELDAVSKTLWIWHWGRKWTSFWDQECRQHIGSWWKVHVPNVFLMSNQTNVQKHVQNLINLAVIFCWYTHMTIMFCQCQCKNKLRARIYTDALF